MCFIRESISNRLSCWKFYEFVERVRNYRIIMLPKKQAKSKISHQFKMYNMHIFFQLSITCVYFSIVKSHQRLKAKEFEIIEVE
jgi:hypothetical protein